MGYVFTIFQLAYAVFEIPTAYFRMAYYLPMALVPLVALALVRLLTPRNAAIAGGVAAVAISGFAWAQASNVRDFYAFTNSASDPKERNSLAGAWPASS